MLAGLVLLWCCVEEDLSVPPSLSFGAGDESEALTHMLGQDFDTELCFHVVSPL